MNQSSSATQRAANTAITRLRRLAREKGYKVNVTFSEVDPRITITDWKGSLLLTAGFRGARCARPFSAVQAADCLTNALWSLA